MHYSILRDCVRDIKGEQEMKGTDFLDQLQSNHLTCPPLLSLAEETKKSCSPIIDLFAGPSIVVKYSRNSIHYPEPVVSNPS